MVNDCQWGVIFCSENLVWNHNPSIFALTNQNSTGMEKYLLDPKASGTFSSEVMHKVVLSGIDFELPDNIWDAIDNAFGNYWNVEVGYGGWPDFNSAVRSISNWLQKEQKKAQRNGKIISKSIWRKNGDITYKEAIFGKTTMPIRRKWNRHDHR